MATRPASMAKIMSQISGIRRPAQQIRDGSSGKYSCHVHDTVSCGTIAGRNELAKDRHVVCIEDTETDAEAKSASYNHQEVMTETEQ